MNWLGYIIYIFIARRAYAQYNRKSELSMLVVTKNGILCLKGRSFWLIDGLTEESISGDVLFHGYIYKKVQ